MNDQSKYVNIGYLTYLVKLWSLLYHLTFWLIISLLIYLVLTTYCIIYSIIFYFIPLYVIRSYNTVYVKESKYSGYNQY